MSARRRALTFVGLSHLWGYFVLSTSRRALRSLPVGELPAVPAQVGAQLRGQLATPPGCVVLTGVPTATNAALLGLARALGSVTATGTTIGRHPLEDGCVYRVEPLAGGRGVEDESGLLMYSTTADVFEGHTDGYHNARPPAFVLLLCVRPDAPGHGVSSVVDGATVVDALDPTTVALLADPVFPTSSGRVAVLTETAARRELRFNLREIHRFRDAGHALDDAHLRAAACLAEAMAAPGQTWRHHLAAGECLVIDNRRALHARDALSAGSRRLLKRVWIDEPEVAA